MPPVGFEPTISAGERPKTYASDRGATGTGCLGSNMDIQKQYLVKLNFEGVMYGYTGFSGGNDVL